MPFECDLVGLAWCLLRMDDGCIFNTINNHTRSNAMNHHTSDSECDDSRMRVRVIMYVIARVSLLPGSRGTDARRTMKWPIVVK